MHRSYSNAILMHTGQQWHKQRQTGQWMKIVFRNIPAFNGQLIFDIGTKAITEEILRNKCFLD